MGITNDATMVYQRNRSEVFEAAQNALPTVKKMKIKEADPASGRIVASSGMSLASWGERVTVEVWEHAPGWAAVRVTSQLKAQLVDWGKNKKNIARVFDAISSALGSPAQPMPEAQPPASA